MARRPAIKAKEIKQSIFLLFVHPTCTCFLVHLTCLLIHLTCTPFLIISLLQLPSFGHSLFLSMGLGFP